MLSAALLGIAFGTVITVIPSTLNFAVADRRLPIQATGGFAEAAIVQASKRAPAAARLVSALGLATIAKTISRVPAWL